MEVVKYSGDTVFTLFNRILLNLFHFLELPANFVVEL